MDYYGYFPTFNNLVIETQIIATLIGFIAVFFIFWFRYTYESEKPTARKNTKKYKEQIKSTQRKLTIGAFAFLLIITSGIFYIVDNTNILQTHPYSFENYTAQNLTIPDFYRNRLETNHQNFMIWIFVNLFYFMILVLTTIGIFKGEKEEKKVKRKDVKSKNGKTIIKKISEYFKGG